MLTVMGGLSVAGDHAVHKQATLIRVFVGHMGAVSMDAITITVFQILTVVVVTQLALVAHKGILGSVVS